MVGKDSGLRIEVLSNVNVKSKVKQRISIGESIEKYILISFVEFAKKVLEHGRAY